MGESEGDLQICRELAKIVQMIPFSGDRKAMGVVVRLSSGPYRLFLEGATFLPLLRTCDGVFIPASTEKPALTPSHYALESKFKVSIQCVGSGL